MMRPLETTDVATVERLSRALNRCFETFEPDDTTFDPEVFCDLYPPFWRFQLQGVDALRTQLKAISGGHEVQSRILRVVPTATGFVMEHEETSLGDTVETARHLDLCEVRDGRIVDFVTYCNGGWDDDLRARHASQAPMLRP